MLFDILYRSIRKAIPQILVLIQPDHLIGKRLRVFCNQQFTFMLSEHAFDGGILAKKGIDY